MRPINKIIANPPAHEKVFIRKHSFIIERPHNQRHLNMQLTQTQVTTLAIFFSQALSAPLPPKSTLPMHNPISRASTPQPKDSTVPAPVLNSVRAGELGAVTALGTTGAAIGVGTADRPNGASQGDNPTNQTTSGTIATFAGAAIAGSVGATQQAIGAAGKVADNLLEFARACRRMLETRGSIGRMQENVQKDCCLPGKGACIRTPVG